jgi:hypothetical protein
MTLVIRAKAGITKKSADKSELPAIGISKPDRIAQTLEWA